MSRFAKNTSVAVDKSRAEIEGILRRYGASHFAYLSEPGVATVAFKARDRNIKFRLTLPKRSDFAKTPTKRDRYENQIDACWEQACRSIWRGLALCIKAKLEAVESKIETFEEAFLPHIILGNGRTIYETIQKNVALNYDGRDVPLLPAPKH